jgi:hypothetical protein
MGDNLLDDPGQIGVHPHRIIAVDAGDEVGALPDVDTVLVTPGRKSGTGATFAERSHWRERRGALQFQRLKIGSRPD